MDITAGSQPPQCQQHPVFMCQCPLNQDQRPPPELPPKRGQQQDQFKTLPPPKSFRNCNNHSSSAAAHKTLPRKLNQESYINGNLTKSNPLYVTQASVAVMTSPTLSSQMGRTSFTTASPSTASSSSSSLSASQATAIARPMPPTQPLPQRQIVNMPVSSEAGVATPARLMSSSQTGLTSTTSTMSRNLLHSNRVMYDPILTTSRSSVIQRNPAKVFFGCGNGGFWEGRSCIERFIFGLLIMLIVSVFVIGGLICVQVITGSSHGGLRAFSAMVFAAGKNGGDSEELKTADSMRYHPDNDIGKLLDDKDLEIVRIKTTEEVSNVLEARAFLAKDPFELMRMLLHLVNNSWLSERCILEMGPITLSYKAHFHTYIFL